MCESHSVTVPKMLNNTDTDTLSGTKYFQIFPIPVPRLFISNFTYTSSETFLSGTKFFNTGSDNTRKNEKFPVQGIYGTHYKSSKFLNFGDKNQFQYRIFSIPGPWLFSGTKFFWYQFQDFFLVPIFPETVSDTTKKINKYRYWFVTLLL